jgi:Bacteriophage HK97-gp10, putative tail-component
MSVRFQWHGMEEMKAELQNLAPAMAAEARGIVTRYGDLAAAQIIAGYPDRTGTTLRAKVRVVPSDGGPFGAAVTVQNTSKLASIFEDGTQARHTALGANRGSMPPGHVFIPTMMRVRFEMFDVALRALLIRQGLVVTDV